jgi:hypothetical protein
MVDARDRKNITRYCRSLTASLPSARQKQHFDTFYRVHSDCCCCRDERELFTSRSSALEQHSGSGFIEHFPFNHRCIEIEMKDGLMGSLAGVALSLLVALTQSVLTLSWGLRGSFMMKRRALSLSPSSTVISKPTSREKKPVEMFADKHSIEHKRLFVHSNKIPIHRLILI